MKKKLENSRQKHSYASTDSFHPMRITTPLSSRARSLRRAVSYLRVAEQHRDLSFKTHDEHERLLLRRVMRVFALSYRAVGDLCSREVAS